MEALLARSTVYVPGAEMHTTELVPGKPALQSDALAFQLVVPATGPCQLSVHAGGCAPFGMADPSATPVKPNDTHTRGTAVTTRGEPRNQRPGSALEDIAAGRRSI